MFLKWHRLVFLRALTTWFYYWCFVFTTLLTWLSSTLAQSNQIRHPLFTLGKFYIEWYSLNILPVGYFHNRVLCYSNKCSHVLKIVLFKYCIFVRMCIVFPKGFYSKSIYSEGSLFRKFYSEGSFFRRFLSWRVIIPKISIPKVIIPKIRIPKGHYSQRFLSRIWNSE